MISSPTESDGPKPLQKPLLLTIRNLGPVPTKKNSKQISRNRRTGKPFIRTDDDIKAWTDAAILLLLSELNSAYRAAVAMGTAACPHCWIASSVPENDSAKHIRAGSFHIIDVPEGQEGAVIDVRPISYMDDSEATAIYAGAWDEVRRENQEHMR
jgi:hypothetical protein